VELAQEFRDQCRVERDRRVSAAQVQLDAIARAQDDGLAAVAGGQLVQRAWQAVAVEGQLLAQLDRRVVKAAPHDEEHHGPPPRTDVWEEASVNNSRAKATIVSSATRRPRRW